MHKKNSRVIYDLISSDTVETQTYSGVGIVTNSFDLIDQQCGENKQKI